MVDYNYKIKAIRVFNLNYPWVMVEKKTNRVVDNANGEGYPTVGAAWKNWKRQHKLGIAPKVGKAKVKYFRRKARVKKKHSALANKKNEYNPVISPTEKRILEQRLATRTNEV